MHQIFDFLTSSFGILLEFPFSSSQSEQFSHLKIKFLSAFIHCLWDSYKSCILDTVQTYEFKQNDRMHQTYIFIFLLSRKCHIYELLKKQTCALHIPLLYSYMKLGNDVTMVTVCTNNLETEDFLSYDHVPFMYICILYYKN